MFQFYMPWFALLLPLPLLVRFFLPKENKNEKSAALLFFPAVKRLKHSFSKDFFSKAPKKNFFFFFLFVSWIFLVAALMQPEKVDRFSQIKNNGYDLMLAVDASASMLAVDFSSPGHVMNRLDVTKKVVGDFVKARHGDRVGLVIFGEHAYLHVPLTLDTLSVSKLLNDTLTGMAGNATAIGDAIGISVKNLRGRPEGSRVLILLTDGEDNASTLPPLEAAKLAKQYGIKIYTIGIGKNGAAPFPSSFGGYVNVQVSLDEELLKNIAETTGGKYFHATDQKMLESIYSTINKLEKTDANETLFLVREPYYYYPLGASMALILLLSLYQFTTRRKVCAA